MANTVEQPEGFPVFELGYSDSVTGGLNYARSQNGKISVRLANGGQFRWISLRIVSSAIPLSLKYKCLYKPADAEGDILHEALQGEKCPPEGAGYIKKVAFQSKIYYRCWLSGKGRPDEFELNPAGAFWCYNGRFCGTTDDDRWITALEIRMPSLIEAWRSA